MKRLLGLILIIAIIQGCDKKKEHSPKCDLVKTWEDNEARVTITQGVWGTIAEEKGHCPPVTIADDVIDRAKSSDDDCSFCPVSRRIQIYEATTRAQTDTVAQSYTFYHRFHTRLIKEVDADNNGFYQLEVPPGEYTIVNVEEGKLYVSGVDGRGILNPVTVKNGPNWRNLYISYRVILTP